MRRTCISQADSEGVRAQDPDHRPVVVWHRVYEDGRHVPRGNVLRLHGGRLYLPLLPILRADPAGIEGKGSRTGGGSGSGIGSAGRDHGCCFGTCDHLRRWGGSRQQVIS